MSAVATTQQLNPEANRGQAEHILLEMFRKSVWPNEQHLVSHETRMKVSPDEAVAAEAVLNLFSGLRSLSGDIKENRIMGGTWFANMTKTGWGVEGLTAFGAEGVPQVFNEVVNMLLAQRVALVGARGQIDLSAVDWRALRDALEKDLDRSVELIKSALESIAARPAPL